MRVAPPLLHSRPLLAVRGSAPAHAAVMLSPAAVPFDAPTDWFVYGHLHFILALPTLTLLSLSPPLQRAAPVQKQAAYAFIAFIVVVGVVQSFIWDSYGASLGIWEFNPAKCTLRESIPLPVEEAPPATLAPPRCGRVSPASAAGGWALALSPDDSVKCLGLVALAFSPVWLVIWSIGSSFVLRHADRITWGWFAPGVTTVLIDCLGQQQGVWRFPPAFLSGIGSGYLKLDIFLVYMVSTFAVTGTGAVILAAAEELLARRSALGEPPPESLLEVASYIWSSCRASSLSVGGEAEALSYEGSEVAAAAASG
ncbi:hypothetical protein EMIHUDRAFT_466833 [Emiliania huxleyi CCMP1516]|uniref:Uncharacterized protein n=2 Tax=Emiliania huxleyi TaxID=2903 RepID=A0A0D3KRN8_EMIH1|nr:hypothetical protein EMIHUDRAFT_466833 [Emiliania huxleyi CCMP1516]EOD38423.1 hypothetical protein EMIHUDRAFT_466833 [Emiliania huxleyi CCMP1516]|eukprot:XP_005790852.1 hypothetical protein EMIHUDRAFT_466833 [Emiliania huxleyi CCMP1516]